MHVVFKVVPLISGEAQCNVLNIFLLSFSTIWSSKNELKMITGLTKEQLYYQGNPRLKQ